MDKRHWEHGPCPKHDCRKDSCKCGLRLISFPAALGDDSKGSPVAPKNGDYCNALVKYESNGHMYVYSTEGVPERLSSNGTLNFEELLNRPQYNGEIMTGETNIPEVPSAVSQLTNDLDFQTGEEVDSTVTSAVATETAARQQADNTLQNSVTTVSNNLSSEVTARQNADTALRNSITGVSNNLSSEVTARQNADNNLQSQIDGISASSDVKDIVGTYAELQAYDTSTLGDNDIIKVLQDEAHLDETTYYRWSTATQTFTLIGEEGPYYTKSATDSLLNAKADKATTYTKTETDGLLSGKQNVLTAGTNITIVGDVISASDSTAVVQTPGVSTTSVMSQKAATKMVYKVLEGSSPNVVSGAIQIDPTYAGAPSQVTDQDDGDVIMIGRGAAPTGSGSCRSIQIGAESQSDIHGTALGFKAIETSGEGVALGAFSKTGTTDVVSVGNSDATTYVDIYGQTVTVPAFTRRIINVSTPTSANDAATKDYVDNSLSGKQNTLTAGSNISISGNTISATDTTYTAGDGLDLAGTTFSVDTDVVATQGDVTRVTNYITDATEYSASATYAVGDYVIHDGNIYQCNIAIVGGEAWDASHWDAVPSLQEQLDNTETWTFKLEGGTTVTKKVVVR